MKRLSFIVCAVLTLLSVAAPAYAADVAVVDPAYYGSVLTITSQAKTLTGTVGQFFSAGFQVNGGNPTYNWQVDPALPAGLSLSVSPDAYTNCISNNATSDVTTSRCPGAYTSGQNIVISGTPTQAGTSVVKFIVTDSAAHKTAASFTFTIQQSGGASSRGITVSSPTSGEVWALGSTHTITWIDETGSSMNRSVYIALEPYIACLYSNPACAVVQIAPYVIASNAPGTGSFTWTVPTDLASRYQTAARVIVSTSDGALSGNSAVFSIARTGSETVVKTGYVDGASSAKVSGWAYDQSAQPTCVTISYQRLYTTNAKTDVYLQPTQQACPSVNRTDAEAWLRRTYGTGLNISQPLGFAVDPSTVLSAGTYVVQSVTLAQSGVALQLSDAAKASFTIGTVSTNPLTLTTDSSLTGSVGQQFSAGFSVNGGSVPYQSWQITSGALPSGLALSFPAFNCFVAPCIAPKDTAYISGTPTTNGNYPFTLKVTDSAGRTVEQAFTITIGASGTKTITVTTDGALQGVVGAALSVSFSGANGTAPYTIQLDGGTVPPGMAFTTALPACAQPADGSRVTCPTALYMLTGTPTVAGIYTFTVSARDAVGNKGSQNFKMVITNTAVGRSLTVTAPQKDEVLTRGQFYTIRWTPVTPGSTVSISASRYIACLHNDTYVCAVAQPAPVNIVSAAPDTGAFVWNIPADFGVTGIVSIVVTNSTSSLSGESAPFQISDKSTTGCAFASGQLVVGTVGTVYLITSNCTKYGFTSYQDFISRGYKFSQVQRVDQALLDGIPAISTLPRAAGMTFKYEGKAAVYYLNASQCKEVYPSLATLRTWKLDIRDIVTIATSEQYPDCTPSYVRLPENTPVRASGDGTIYVIRTGMRYPFGNIGAFYRAGFSFKQVVVITAAERDFYPLGGILE